VQVLQRPGGDALPLGREAQEDVLCPDHVMPEAPRLFLRENHHFLRPLGKPPEHRVSPSLGENLSSRLRAARAAQPPSFSARRSRSRMRAARFSSRARSEEHTSELQSREKLVCRLLLEKKKGKDETDESTPHR